MARRRTGGREPSKPGAGVQEGDGLGREQPRAEQGGVQQQPGQQHQRSDPQPESGDPACRASAGGPGRDPDPPHCRVRHHAGQLGGRDSRQTGERNEQPGEPGRPATAHSIPSRHHSVRLRPQGAHRDRRPPGIALRRGRNTVKAASLLGMLGRRYRHCTTTTLLWLLSPARSRPRCPNTSNCSR